MECFYRTSTNCAPKAKCKKTPEAVAGGPGGRAMDAGEGVVNKKVKLKLNFNFLTLLVKGWLSNKKGGMTVTKKMRRAIWQLTGNWGTLQS